jgi:hypothetical protein
MLSIFSYRYVKSTFSDDLLEFATFHDYELSMRHIHLVHTNTFILVCVYVHRQMEFSIVVIAMRVPLTLATVT